MIVAAGLLIACPAAAQDLQPERPSAVIDIASHVRDASLRFGIPESWIWAVMRVESAGRIDATSPVGAMGLMQVMPGTWANLTARHGLGGNAYDPRANIMAGAAYLRQMHDRYGSPGFLAAYNAGPGRYEQYLRGERGLPTETQNYVARLAPMIGGGATVPHTVTTVNIAASSPPPRPSWTQASLFAVRSPSIEDTDSVAEAATPSPRRVASPAPLNGLFAPVAGRSTQ
ncbi:MAG: lytic transglycosylase domain-containing protein [Pseudomonadota bacterium]